MKNGSRPEKQSVLKDHKRVGKRLIPPMMQFERMTLFSFADELLPSLIWISAFFLRSSDRQAVDNTIEFLRMAQSRVETKGALARFENFLLISDAERAAIREASDDQGFTTYFQSQLWHHNHLLNGYPLDFLFDGNTEATDREEAISRLAEDVAALLDRHSRHATKVQTTAMVALMASGKMFLSSDIDAPDFNSIFTAPDSDEARRTASFVRATVNSGLAATMEHGNTGWPKKFWHICHALRGCE